ncbi:MAG: glycoside hydrolase family 2 protein [Christensenellales bacterium]|jgi:hypothetical protein
MIPKPEFPRPDRRRADWKNLNGTWDFKLLTAAGAGDEPGGYDRAITVPFSWASPLSGVGENCAGIGWYQRTTEFSASGRIFLCFGAVDYLCDVYVNDAHVRAHRGGYTQFDIDVTDVWRAGENEIVVRAEDFRRETQTYGKQGYGDIQGIWQTVWLEARGEAYIEKFRFETKCDGRVTLTAHAAAADGAVVTAAFEDRVFTGKIENGVAMIEMEFDAPRLWSPDDPQLYEGTIALENDIVHTYFGIREIEAKDGRILLNGAPIYINGVLDQAFHPQGHFTYPDDKSMRDEAWRVKRLGLNMARIHIKPEEPRKLYWMDKLGVLIMQDMPCFWGEPNDEARAAYESEWPDAFDRDFNHPSIFSWVMFNETWGLFTGAKDARKFLPETQEWVRDVYKRAKENDPTRLIEDNSPCNYDHVETDINTWHFYLNGYELVREHIKKVSENTYPGSGFNYIGENKQTGAPLMNSECGMVWGVDGSAGDSDIAWQYRYMLNEFRLYDNINGFIFTEFHDVVNEFNGYYRIDDKDKDFGYRAFCRGMTVRDLHAAAFLALDCAPCRTVDAGAAVEAPCAISNFSDNRSGLRVAWELWHDAIDGRVSDQKGEFAIPEHKLGLTRLAPIQLTMPRENAVAILSVYLMDGEQVISRNFTTFDVRGAMHANAIEIPVAAGASEGFQPRWGALGGEKLCLGGAGSVSYEIPVGCEPNDIDIYLEAGAKRVLSKDLDGEPAKDQQDLGFMRGYLVDRGAFQNSYWMTDEDQPISEMTALIDGVEIAKIALVGDNADARGVLSWHYQPDDRKLDEAGSYGQLVHLRVPSRLITGIAARGAFTLTLRATDGLAIYGRNAGRYAVGLTVVTE